MKSIFAHASRRQLIILALCLIIAGVLIFVDAVSAQTDAPLSAVCSPGSTKYEAGAGYEYGAEHAEISIAGPYAAWQAKNPATTIYQVCVKSATQLYHPPSGPLTGEFTTPDGKDISHVVVYLQTPNDVGITDFQAAPRGLFEADPNAAQGGAPAGLDSRYMLVGLILCVLVIAGFWMLGDIRNQED